MSCAAARLTLLSLLGSQIQSGVNDTAANLLAAIQRGEEEISPSTVFAVACILEGVSFINGSPQNTFVPGCLELADEKQVYVGGDDFKSGQTKMKSVLVDFLIGSGTRGWVRLALALTVRSCKY